MCEQGNSHTVQPEEYDPVCGMKVDPSNAAASFEYQGATVYFCSLGCAAKFRAAPQKYLKAKLETPASHPQVEAVSHGEYTCPMHPQIVRQGPGSCPICGMALEPREVTAEDSNPELNDMTRLLWISVVLAAPMLALMVSSFLPSMPMQHMFSARVWTWVEFTLATPVVLWCGLPFFVRGVYKVAVTGSGMITFTSSQISLHAGEARIVPPATLTISGGTTSVTVNGSKEALAEEQVHIAEQQRIGKVIPNFYSSYDWNAPPMQAKQKFQLSARSLIDPVSFLTVAGIAGAEQNRNIFPAYGSGIEGYSKRYGAALANHVTGNLFAKAVYPSIFHQDPRYFYKGTGSGTSRAFYAVSSAFITRNDSGRRVPNYSHILGGFTAAAISNLYYPESDRGASLVLLNGLADIGADAAANLVREFVLKGITSHVTKDNRP